MQTLQPNTLLQGGRYKIIKTLGQGGFGITYLAIQSGLEREVAVKEFFMKDFCERDSATSHVTLGMETSRDMVKRFRAKFIKEARNIAKLNHPNIVRIIDVFEENGTAYYVMEYSKGGSLGEKLRKKGSFSKPVATRYITQVAEAVGYIHQRKMNHLDIKPDNIMLSGDDNVILIDFGLSKQYDATTGSQTSSTPVGISEGYAPIEQYQIGGVASFTPETDMYSLGATYFKLLTGITPPSAPSLIENGISIELLKNKRVSKTVIDLICRTMEPRKKDRVQSASVFLSELSTSSQSHAPIEEGATTILCDTNKEYDDAMQLYNKGQYSKAFPILEKLANSGNAEAMFRLGVCYYWNEGIERDKTNSSKCKDWMLKAAKRGNSDAMYWLGAYLYENGVGVAKNKSKSVEWLGKAVEAKNHSAEITLGITYLAGESVGIDEEKGSSLINKGFRGLINRASDLSREEMHVVAMWYQHGKDNIEKAIYWYEKACDLGDPEAMYALGQIFMDGGEGVATDEHKALILFKCASSKYLSNALKNLGDCYMFGKGTRKNYTQALSTYHKAAEEGSVDAMFMIGLCFQGGYGQRKSYQQAAEWYKKSLKDTNNPEALNCLGLIYEEGGYGIQKDEDKALYYYKQAAEQGHANAQCKYGLSLIMGYNGDEHKLEQGFDFLQKSAVQGNEEAIDFLNSLDEVNDDVENISEERLGDQIYSRHNGETRTFYVGENWSILNCSENWIHVKKDGMYAIVTIDAIGWMFGDNYRKGSFSIMVNNQESLVNVYQSRNI